MLRSTEAFKVQKFKVMLRRAQVTSAQGTSAEGTGFAESLFQPFWKFLFPSFPYFLSPSPDILSTKIGTEVYFVAF